MSRPELPSFSLRTWFPFLAPPISPPAPVTQKTAAAPAPIADAPPPPKPVVPSSTQPALTPPGTATPASDDVRGKDVEFERLRGIVKNKGTITVAILEGGVDFSHDALKDHTW